MSTLFLTNEVILGEQVPSVLAATHNVSDFESGSLELAEGDSYVLSVANWALFFVKVVGALDVTVDSTDFDDTTPISGTVGTYGIAKYPGMYSLVTKTATITLTGGVGGAILEYVKANLIDDTQL